MARRKPAAPPPAPVYVKPQLDRRERAAMAAFRAAAYCGKRNTPRRGSFDPLLLRQGLRARTVMARAGWVVSNPLYDASLRRRPDTDPSLPGTAWLREVYRYYPALTVLPWTLAHLEARAAVHQAQLTLPAAVAPVALLGQIDLFEGVAA